MKIVVTGAVRSAMKIVVTGAVMSAMTGAMASAGARASAGEAAGSLRLYPLGLPCLFHQLTGLYCPGCGCTRALHHLVRGEPIAAIGSNPLLAVAVPFLLLAIVEPRLSGPWRAGPRKVLQSPVTGWGLVVASVLFSVMRNLPFGAFRWLAP